METSLSRRNTGVFLVNSLHGLWVAQSMVSRSWPLSRNILFLVSSTLSKLPPQNFAPQFSRVYILHPRSLSALSLPLILAFFNLLYRPVVFCDNPSFVLFRLSLSVLKYFYLLEEGGSIFHLHSSLGHYLSRSENNILSRLPPSSLLYRFSFYLISSGLFLTSLNVSHRVKGVFGFYVDSFFPPSLSASVSPLYSSAAISVNHSLKSGSPQCLFIGQPVLGARSMSDAQYYECIDFICQHYESLSISFLYILHPRELSTQLPDSVPSVSLPRNAAEVIGCQHLENTTLAGFSSTVMMHSILLGLGYPIDLWSFDIPLKDLTDHDQAERKLFNWLSSYESVSLKSLPLGFPE